MRATPDLPLETLSHGDIRVKGRMPWSSNATFLVEIDHDDQLTLAVYKPARGERPLWDFPGGLFKREAAAWQLSEALGWNVVPPTVIRDGPLGEGSVQLFIKADFAQHYFTLVDDEAHHPALKTICAFDLLANSADRKSGHCLLGPDNHIWAVDNGLTFHDEVKLRTVIWQFAEQDLAPELVGDIKRLVDDGIPEGLAELLQPAEREALSWRAESMLRSPRFPTDHTGRRHPWPLV